MAMQWLQSIAVDRGLLAWDGPPNHRWLCRRAPSRLLSKGSGKIESESADRSRVCRCARPARRWAWRSGSATGRMSCLLASCASVPEQQNPFVWQLHSLTGVDSRQEFARFAVCMNRRLSVAKLVAVCNRHEQGNHARTGAPTSSQQSLKPVLLDRAPTERKTGLEPATPTPPRSRPTTRPALGVSYSSPVAA